MLINDRAFDGTIYHYTTDRALRLCGVTASWFTEFRPVRFPCDQTFYSYLYELHKHRVCCFLTGTFVLFTVGVLESFDGVTLFMALMDTPVLNLIFQRGPDYIRKFTINEFKFLLVGVQPSRDIFHYLVSHDDFCMVFVVLGVDTTRPCGLLSNVDFVHFIWNNFSWFNYRKYATTLLPSGPPSLPRLLCLKHYRVNRDGWRLWEL